MASERSVFWCSSSHDWIMVRFLALPHTRHTHPVPRREPVNPQLGAFIGSEHHQAQNALPLNCVFVYCLFPPKHQRETDLPLGQTVQRGRAWSPGTIAISFSAFEAPDLLGHGNVCCNFALLQNCKTTAGMVLTSLSLSSRSFHGQDFRLFDRGRLGEKFFGFGKKGFRNFA